jgi:hypothetical protein
LLHCNYFVVTLLRISIDSYLRACFLSRIRWWSCPYLSILFPFRLFILSFLCGWISILRNILNILLLFLNLLLFYCANLLMLCCNSKFILSICDSFWLHTIFFFLFNLTNWRLYIRWRWAFYLILDCILFITWKIISGWLEVFIWFACTTRRLMSFSTFTTTQCFICFLVV